MLFTDSEGREYEYVGELTGAPPIEGGSIIRPVKQEPEDSYRLYIQNDITQANELYYALGSLSQDQAQLIMEAVEALMIDITGRDDQVSHLVHRINKARQSLKEENNA